MIEKYRLTITWQCMWTAYYTVFGSEITIRMMGKWRENSTVYLRKSSWLSGFGVSRFVGSSWVIRLQSVKRAHLFRNVEENSFCCTEHILNVIEFTNFAITKKKFPTNAHVNFYVLNCIKIIPEQGFSLEMILTGVSQDSHIGHLIFSSSSSTTTDLSLCSLMITEFLLKLGILSPSALKSTNCRWSTNQRQQTQFSNSMLWQQWHLVWSSQLTLEPSPYCSDLMTNDQ